MRVTLPLQKKMIYMIYSTSSPRSGNILQSQTESENGKKHRFFFFTFFNLREKGGEKIHAFFPAAGGPSMVQGLRWEWDVNMVG